MTNEQILELIGTKPGIRTVEISDRLDCDIEQLQDMLMDLFRSGLIVARDIIGPNKRPAKAYWLKGVAQVAASTTPAEIEITDETGPAKSKVELAIRFVAANGNATSADLHKLLKLKPTDYASSYLNSALKDGRLVKEGKIWTLGTGVPCVAPAGMENKGPFEAPTVSTRLESAAPPPVITVKIETPAEAAPASAVLDEEAKPLPIAAPSTPIPGFSCALWSHGELQMVRDGAELAKLTADETKQLCEYLDRLAESIEVAP